MLTALLLASPALLQSPRNLTPDEIAAAGQWTLAELHVEVLPDPESRRLEVGGWMVLELESESSPGPLSVPCRPAPADTATIVTLISIPPYSNETNAGGRVTYSEKSAVTLLQFRTYRKRQRPDILPRKGQDGCRHRTSRGRAACSGLPWSRIARASGR